MQWRNKNVVLKMCSVHERTFHWESRQSERCATQYVGHGYHHDLFRRPRLGIRERWHRIEPARKDIHKSKGRSHDKRDGRCQKAWQWPSRGE